MDVQEPFVRMLAELELRQLRQLAVVFERRSISAAAKTLAIAQPALSRSLRNAERIVGSRLFERSARGVVPTAIGNALLRYHQAIEANLRNAAGELDEIRGVSTAMIRLGVGPIEGAAIAAVAISRFLDRHPSVRVTIREGIYAALEPAIAGGSIDAIVGGEPTSDLEIARQPALQFEFLGEIHPVIVVRAAHPLAKKRGLTLRDLHDVAWIVPHGNTSSGERFRAAFQDAGLTPPQGQILAPISSWTAVGLVRRKNLVAMLPRHLVKHELESGALLELDLQRQLYTAPVYLITPKNTELSPTQRDLFDDIRAVCKTLHGAFP